MAHPEWAVKFRRPGTELRRVNDSLYKLYECSSVYDKVNLCFCRQLTFNSNSLLTIIQKSAIFAIGK